MEELSIAIESFFIRYPEALKMGELLNRDGINHLSGNVKMILPPWYVDMMTTYPLYGIEIGIPHNFGQPKLKGNPPDRLPLLSIAFKSFEEIEHESNHVFPGFELIRDNYLALAEERNGEREGIYFKVDAPNPPPILIFHDDGTSNQELIRNGTSLSNGILEFFNEAKVLNHQRVLITASKSSLHKHILVLIKDLKEKRDLADEKLAFEKLIQECDEKIKKEAYLEILLLIESVLYDLQVAIRPQFFEHLKKSYELGGLHPGDLCFLEELIKSDTV